MVADCKADTAYDWSLAMGRRFAYLGGRRAMFRGRHLNGGLHIVKAVKIYKRNDVLRSDPDIQLLSRTHNIDILYFF
jgi:hypothetical protein